MPPVSAARLLRELLALAARLGVEVRAEPFAHGLRKRGGLCRVAGRTLVVMDETLPTMDRIGVLLQALAQLDLQEATVSPFVRALIEEHRAKKRAARKRRGAPARPGLARAKRRA